MAEITDMKLAFTNKKKPEVMQYKKAYEKHWKNISVAHPERFEPAHNKGLTIKQVNDRIDNYFVNYVRKGTIKSVRSILISNICTFYNLLALIIGVILIWNMAVLGDHLPPEERMGISNLLFLGIFGANIIIGIVQELRSKFTLERLSIIASAKVSVLRESKKYVVLPEDVVLDDVVMLETGNQIQADGILLHGAIEVNESLLTGESVPVQKNKGDEIFAGSFVVSGTGSYRVNKIGKDNYIQTMAKSVSKYTTPKSELLSTLRYLIKTIGGIIFLLTILLIVAQLVGMTVVTDSNISRLIIQTSGAILGMIPAGMFLLTSLALAVGVINLSKANTWVRELYCIETLARVNTLCLDKTGTITDGTMKIVDVIEIKPDSKKFHLRQVISSMLYALGDNNQTSVAMKDYFGQECIFKAKQILPFSSARKLSAVTFNSEIGTYTIGAPEFMFKDMSQKLGDVVTKLASQGYRVLAIGKSKGEIKNEEVSLAIEPVALITLQDTIRREAPRTIKWFRDNGVDIRIISGDNPITVSEVAKRVGVEGAEKFISLHGLSPLEVRAAAKTYTVFGRVTPEQKLLLIKEFKSNGRMVAMTGDGINDILALKEADCSIAMASGSEAVRNVSQLVLMDSNFASMPKVVLEGRRVVNNIQKSSSLYLFKTFFTIMLTIVCLVMRDGIYFFDTSNLLLLEAFVIGVPSVMLALERNSQQIKGRFIVHILRNALSSALVVLVFICALLLFQNYGLFGIDTESIFTTLSIYAVILTGFAMLFRMIQPINSYRITMFLSVALVTLLFVWFAPDMFGIAKLNQEVHVLLMLLMLFVAYSLISFFNNALSKIELSTNIKDKI